MTQTIAVIRGDGIGPEIMDATLHVLDAMQLGLTYEFVDAGMVALEKHGELLPAATMDAKSATDTTTRKAARLRLLPQAAAPRRTT